MKKIISSTPFLLLLLVSFMICLFYPEFGWKDSKFIAISNSILESTFKQDSLSLYFSFQKPDQFGLDTRDCALPLYQREEYLTSSTALEETISSLKKIDPDQLSKQARSTYEVLLPYLEQQKKGTAFPYFEEPLSPTGGIHISLPVLLAEFPIGTQEDLEHYLSILSLIPEYFESMVAFETDKATKGMFMSSEDADLVISQCEFFSSTTGEKLFLDCFQLTLETLFSEDPETYQRFEQEHASIIHNKIAPAYEKLGNSLLLLKESGKPRNGLCQYENGRQYYEYLIQRQIGTDATTEEISQKLYARLQELYTELAQISRSDSTLTPMSPTLDEKQSMITDCLPAIESSMGHLFPLLEETPHLEIKPIPNELAAYTAPAYYFVPAISLCRKGDISDLKNHIYVNREITEDSTELFTTLSHEGYPGHMFQHVYFLSSQGVSKKNILRYCLDFPGYSEGWAMYVELLSFTHAGENKTYLEMLRLSREIQLCLLCILDIRIHDGGAQVGDITPYLARIGITDPDTIENVYCYLINEPGTYLKYYGGYLEILECKELYRQACMKEEKTYSDLDFHTFFLTHGPDSYMNIKQVINAIK